MLDGMADDDERLLAAWLEQVGRMAGEDEDGPDERGYKAVALELGLTKADLLRVEAAVDAHFARGGNYLRHDRPDDAIAELTRARALAPWRADVQHALAEAHVARFHRDGAGGDRAAAARLIRARLEREPDHQPSYALLNRLDRPPAEAPAEAPAARAGAARRRLMLVSLGGVLLMLALSGAMALLLRLEPAPAPAPTPSPADPAAAPAPPQETPPPQDAPPPAGEFDLPVEVVGGPRFEGIAIDPAGSRGRRGDYSNSHLELRIHNTLDGQGLDGLRADYELLDDNGAVLAARPIELLNQAQPTLYPGEAHAFGRSLPGHRHAVAARLVLTGVERKTVGPTPPEARPICVEWAVERPAHVDVDFGLTGARWTLGTVTLDFAVRNRGAGALEDLVFTVEHRDADGAPIAETTRLDDETVAARWMPAFEPGELRRARHMKVLGLDDKPRYDHTCLRVTKVY